MSGGKSVRLEVPSGGVYLETTFTITEEVLFATGAPKPTIEAKLVGANTFRVTAKDSTGQPVTTFPKKVSIAITIPDLPDDVSDVGLYYLDAANRLWILIPDAVFGDDIVTFSVDHLTEFAIFHVLGLPPTLPVSFLICDTNKDGKVDILDFNTLMVHWGETVSGNIADCDSDGIVDILDFNLLMVHWTV